MLDFTINETKHNRFLMKFKRKLFFFYKRRILFLKNCSNNIGYPIIIRNVRCYQLESILMKIIRHSLFKLFIFNRNV